jgi:hypothetical protein
MATSKHAATNNPNRYFLVPQTNRVVVRAEAPRYVNMTRSVACCQPLAGRLTIVRIRPIADVCPVQLN